MIGIEMSKLQENLKNLICCSPVFRLSKYEKSQNLNAAILAKLEYFNPAGSIKDKVAFSMIDDAEKKGIIKPGYTIIEPTSGNTGIGLAFICAAKDYKLILTMPSNMSEERVAVLKAYGAEILLTEKEKGMKGAISKAKQLLQQNKTSFMPDQFSNPANPEIHRLVTGPDLWEAANKNIDIFVAGVGTGGTITGVGQFLKSKNKDIKIIAVEPASSAILSGGFAGGHKIQGIGAGFVPKILDQNIYDEVVTVTNQQAYFTTNLLAKKQGILVGISSGAAVFAAGKIAKRDENKGKVIAVILPDRKSVV